MVMLLIFLWSSLMITTTRHSRCKPPRSVGFSFVIECIEDDNGDYGDDNGGNDDNVTGVLILYSSSKVSRTKIKASNITERGGVTGAVAPQAERLLGGGGEGFHHETQGLQTPLSRAQAHRVPLLPHTSRGSLRGDRG